VKDLLYAVLALIAAGVAAWQIYYYVNHRPPRGAGVDIDHTPMIIGVICAIAALVFGALFLSHRVNKQEEIHITE